MNERLKKFMQINHLTAFDVAEKVMMSKYSIEKYVLPANPNRISQRFIAAFLEAYPQVNKEWFLDGIGEMLVQNEDEMQKQIADHSLELLRQNYKNKQASERLRIFMTMHTMTSADLANKLGMSKYTIDKYLQGTPMSARFIQTLLATFPKVRRKWLLEGEGEMLKEEENEAPDTITSNNGMSQSTLESEYQKLMRHHEEETKALHNELDRANSIIERLTEILAKK